MVAACERARGWIFCRFCDGAAAEGTHDCNRLVSAIGRLVVLSHPVPTLLDLLGFFLVDLGHFIASVA